MAADNLWRLDLHLHTYYSRDSAVSPERVIQVARERGLTHVAITDHNTLRGALEGKALAPDVVIVGEEIATVDGELLAYFIHVEIPGGLSLNETIQRIRAQGGIVGVSHPFDGLRSEAVGRAMVEKILPQLDCMEVFNARVVFASANRHAAEFAREHDIPGTAGSDAHSAYEIGKAYVETVPFDGRDGFLPALRQGRIVGGLSCPLIHIISTVNKLRKPHV